MKQQEKDRQVLRVTMMEGDLMEDRRRGRGKGDDGKGKKRQAAASADGAKVAESSDNKNKKTRLTGKKTYAAVAAAAPSPKGGKAAAVLETPQKGKGGVAAVAGVVARRVTRSTQKNGNEMNQGDDGKGQSEQSDPVVDMSKPPADVAKMFANMKQEHKIDFKAKFSALKKKKGRAPVHRSEVLRLMLAYG